MTYYFYFFVGKFPKFFNFSDSIEKIYLVELNIFKENAFHGLQKIPPDNFSRNLFIWRAIVSGACMQKLKIGHRANFGAKNKCFRQILFPVRAILRSIKEARKGFSLLYCLWNEGRLQRRMFNDVANYMSPCNSIVELYFKGTCDVISVTMATHKVHESGL